MKLPKLSWEMWRKGSSAEGPRIFTEHVRSLVAGGDPARGLDELWAALRGALRSELKRRGLWESPPSFLGIYGWERWESGEGTRGGALEELLAECYFYIFVSRLPALQAQLKLKPNVDGLVFLNIRHFLHDRQAEHDPIGSQTFAVLQAAVRLAIEDGELRVLRGDEKVRNDTILGFGLGTGVAEVGSRIGEIVTRWNDELLPDLLTLRGRRMEEVVRKLRGLLFDLSLAGIEVFRFKDLVDPLKADVRARWGALLEREQGESAPGSGETVRIVRPSVQVEERQLFRKLVDCVLAAVARLDVNEKTRSYLSTLWQFLRIQAVEGTRPEPAARLQRSLAVPEEEAEEGAPLSYRRISELLGIPRERLGALYRTLGELLEECRNAVARPGPAEARGR